MEIGRQIEMTIKAFGFNPVYNLTGHGVARYVIHCAPSIPNYPDPKAGRLRENQTIACEPFACDGKGNVESAGPAEVFGLRRLPKPRDAFPADIDALKLCQRHKILIEKKNVRVAQTEHTIFISTSGAEVLTRAP